MKFTYYIIILSLLFCACKKDPTSISKEDDVQLYTRLYKAVKQKNDLWQVSAMFHGDKCKELNFYFENLQNGFPKDFDKIVSGFNYLNKTEMNGRLSTLPDIRNENIRELVLTGGVERLNLNTDYLYFKKLDRLLITNWGEPVKDVSISPGNKLLKLAIVDAQIENIDSLVTNIRDIKSLSLAKNRIRGVGKLPFNEGTFVDLRFNPLEDTSSIKALNPGLIFQFD